MSETWHGFCWSCYCTYVSTCYHACLPSTGECKDIVLGAQGFFFRGLLNVLLPATTSSLLSPSVLFCFPVFHLPPLPPTTLPVFSLNPFLWCHLDVRLNFYFQGTSLGNPLHCLLLIVPFRVISSPLCIVCTSIIFSSLPTSLCTFTPLLSLHHIIYFFIQLPYSLNPLSFGFYVLSPFFLLSITILYVVLCLFLDMNPAG